MPLEPHAQLTVLLQRLAEALREAELWSAQAPSEQAMSSTAPFACDSMAFEQWLQFIFLPRMQALIDGAQPLPRNFAIAPMGEETLDQVRAVSVMKVLVAIDTLMSDAA